MTVFESLRSGQNVKKKEEKNTENTENEENFSICIDRHTRSCYYNDKKVF